MERRSAYASRRSGIEDASKIEIHCLMSIKELEIRNKEDKSVAIDNVSIVPFGNQSWF